MHDGRSKHIVLWLAGLTALSMGGAASAQEAVARLGQVELSSVEVQRLLAGLTPQDRQKLAGNPAELQRVLRNELIGKALLAEARSQGWERRPEVAAQIERARDRVVVSSYVRSFAAPPAGYPRDEEIQAFYQSNKASFSAPAQFQLLQIFISAGQSGDRVKAAEALKKVADLSTKLQKRGAHFEKLARERSEHRETAQKGGDAGWFVEQQMLPEIRRVVLVMKKGEISPAISTPGGWHFVKLQDIRPGAVRPLDEVKGSIASTLRARKAKELETAQVDGLLKRSQLTFDQAALERTVATVR